MKKKKSKKSQSTEAKGKLIEKLKTSRKITKNTVIGVRVSEDIKNKLDKIQKKTGLSCSSIVNQILEEALKS